MYSESLKFLTAGLICVMVAGCVRTYRWVDYSTRLAEVRRPMNPEQRWGEYQLGMVQDSAVYEDAMIRAVVAVAAGGFYLNLLNKTPHAIQLVWDEAAYVGPRGSASNVATGDTRLIDIGRSRLPTNVPAQARVQLTVIPDVHVIQLTTSHMVRDFVEPYDPWQTWGPEARISLLLPIRFEGVTNEYSFTFTLRDMRLIEHQYNCTGPTCTLQAAKAHYYEATGVLPPTAPTLPEREVQPPPAAAASVGAPPPTDPSRCQVAAVTDGDTFVCRDGRVIDLLLVDALELTQGPLATAPLIRLRELLPVSSYVTIDLEGLQRGPQEETIAFVTNAGGVNVNEEMLRNGFAVLSDHAASQADRARLQAISDDARASSRGLWATTAFDCLPADHRAGRCNSR